MKSCGARRSAWEDERLEGLELVIASIDVGLELFDASLVDNGFGKMLLHLFAVRSCQQRADAEEVALNSSKDFVNARVGVVSARYADIRIQLVDVTISIDAWMVLVDAATAKESGVALVAGSRIDLHEG